MDLFIYELWVVIFMKNRYLYLLGGHSFQKEANKDFVEKAGGARAR